MANTDVDLVTPGDTPVFFTDYSIKGTAKCRKCKKRIPKLELRIAKSSRFNNKEIKIFFHVKCIFESFKKARKQNSIITCNSQIEGFNEIEDDDQALINALISKVKPIVEKSDSKL